MGEHMCLASMTFLNKLFVRGNTDKSMRVTADRNQQEWITKLNTCILESFESSLLTFCWCVPLKALVINGGTHIFAHRCVGKNYLSNPCLIELIQEESKDIQYRIDFIRSYHLLFFRTLDLKPLPVLSRFFAK